MDQSGSKDDVMQMFQSQKKKINFDMSGTKYDPVENIGTGAYGVVCSAVNIKSKGKVAIKKIPTALNNPTVAKRTLREIAILKHFCHPNVIAILDMIAKPGAMGMDIYIVLDLMETDLHQIIYSDQPLTQDHVKYFMYQLLRGLKYIHSANIIHRDLKPSNLMVNSDCLLKIGDFGMARSLADPEAVGADAFMTQYVATRWYRAPELLFSMLEYSTAVDVWSAGCIFAEMLMRRQIFPGKDHLSQLKLIVYYLGTPPVAVMEKIQSDIHKRVILSLGQKIHLPWSNILPKQPGDAIDLASKLLKLAPWERATASDGLEHRYLMACRDEPSEITIETFKSGLSDLELIPKDCIGEAIMNEIEWFKAKNRLEMDQS